MKRSILLAACLGVLSACSVIGVSSDSAAIEFPPEKPSYAPIAFDGETATAIERSECHAAGGEVMKAGMLGWENCIQPMPDAGQACSSQSDCIDRCMIPLGEESAEFGEPATGQCSVNDSPFGCYQTVENGIATPVLCVD